MKPSYSKEGNKLTFSFDYNQNILASIKELDWKDRKYDPIGKQWTVTMSILNQNKVKDIIDRYGFSLYTPTNSESREDSNVNLYLEKKSRLNTLRSFRSEIAKIGSKIKPYPYQEEGIDFMCSWPKMINGDDMGIGKTYQTIFSAEIMNRFPCLLICPSSTKYQWKRFWSQVNPSRSVSIIDSGNSEKNWKADVIIINYDMLGKKELFEKEGQTKERVLPKFPELLTTKWNYIVIDEIHYCKNSKSLRSKIVKLISKGVDNVHGLTGTLVENKPSEIINPLNIIGTFSDVFGNWNNFTTRYCDAKETRFGLDVSGSSNTVELNRLLRETCYIRREKRDVLKDLPPIQSSILEIEISNRKEYKKAEDEFIDYMTDNYSKAKVDSAMMAEFLVQRNQLRQLSVKGKTKEIGLWLEDFKEQSEEKVLVVGNYSEPLQLLSKHFGSDLIDGSKDSKEKRRLIDNWNNSDDQFLFGNTQAVGTGTDGLQEKCSTMVIIDLPDKSSTLDQLVSRLERIGQKNSVNVYYLLSSETIDLRLWEAIEIKRKIMKEINSGKEVKQTSFNDLIVKSYLKRL